MPCLLVFSIHSASPYINFFLPYCSEPSLSPLFLSLLLSPPPTPLRCRCAFADANRHAARHRRAATTAALPLPSPRPRCCRRCHAAATTAALPASCCCHHCHHHHCAATTLPVAMLPLMTLRCRQVAAKLPPRCQAGRRCRALLLWAR